MTITVVTTDTAASSPIQTGGTFTVGYPTGFNSGSFSRFNSSIWVEGLQSIFREPGDVTFAFGTSEATITYNGDTTIPQGSRIEVRFATGDESGFILPNADFQNLVKISYGAPGAADPDGLIDGGEIEQANGMMIVNRRLDFPRNIVASWTTASTVVVHGQDVYGNQISQGLTADGTAITGTKAFARVGHVTSSAAITNLDLGWGNVLGLPVRLGRTIDVVRTLLNGAAITTGTYTVGDGSAVSVTSGDIRGTYTPVTANAPNGTRTFETLLYANTPPYTGADLTT